jgi:hypothetical protein
VPTRPDPYVIAPDGRRDRAAQVPAKYFAQRVAGSRRMSVALPCPTIVRTSRWSDFNRELLRLGNRVGVYVALMDDRYPSTDSEQAVHLDFEYPVAHGDLNRWLPLVR